MRLADLTRNWTLKLTALGLAVLLWSTVRLETTVRQTIADVPVRVDLRDPDWIIERTPVPQTVSVVLEGPTGQMVRLVGERPTVVLPIEEVEDSTGFYVVHPRYVRLDGDLADRITVVDVRPSTVRLFFEGIDTRLLPLSLPLRGTLPEGLQLAGPARVEPAAIRVSGPARRLELMDSVRLQAVDLAAAARAGGRIRVPVDTAGLGQLIVSPSRADVTIPLRQVPLDTLAPEPPDTLPADTAAAATGVGEPSR